MAYIIVNTVCVCLTQYSKGKGSKQDEERMKQNEVTRAIEDKCSGENSRLRKIKENSDEE